MAQEDQWLPNDFSSANLLSTFDLPAKGARKPRPPRPPASHPIAAALARADALLAALVDGRAGTQADLATKSNVTRARVNQLLKLHRLAPEIMAFLRQLPATTSDRRISERTLRPLLDLEPAKQIRRARSMVPGFDQWARESTRAAAALR